MCMNSDKTLDKKEKICYVSSSSFDIFYKTLTN